MSGNRNQSALMLTLCNSAIRLLPAVVITMALTEISSAQHTVFVEAEMFNNHGGWELDQQAMETMGSPYLLAHGLGIAVKDAVTKVRFEQSGEYRVWVRTRDWVAPWKACMAWLTCCRPLA